MNHVRVGVCAFVLHNNRVLLGKRKGSHEPGTWCFPGGHLDPGEKVADCIVREVKEETNLDVQFEKLLSVSNDIMGEKHYITLAGKVKVIGGELRRMEPEKCDAWEWFDLDQLPAPLFLPSARAIENYKKNTFFID